MDDDGCGDGVWVKGTRESDNTPFIRNSLPMPWGRVGQSRDDAQKRACIYAHTRQPHVWLITKPPPARRHIIQPPCLAEKEGRRRERQKGRKAGRKERRNTGISRVLSTGRSHLFAADLIYMYLSRQLPAIRCIYMYMERTSILEFCIFIKSKLKEIVLWCHFLRKLIHDGILRLCSPARSPPSLLHLEQDISVPLFPRQGSLPCPSVLSRSSSSSSCCSSFPFFFLFPF